ncbi:hypothetical protein BH11ACT3_BH11ACT3_14710 [soil metagenome]
MTEHELHGMWATARRQLIASQLAPTLLLAAAIWLVLQGLGAQPGPIKVAAALVLLSSGILGAVAQISVAREAKAIAEDLAAVENPSAVTKQIVASAKWTVVPRFVTPVIFVLTFLALLWAIFAPIPLGGMMPANGTGSGNDSAVIQPAN